MKGADKRGAIWQEVEGINHQRMYVLRPAWHWTYMVKEHRVKRSPSVFLGLVYFLFCFYLAIMFNTLKVAESIIGRTDP